MLTKLHYHPAIHGAILLLAIVVSSSVILSFGAGEPFWKVNDNLALPFLFATIVMGLAIGGIYCVVMYQARARRYGWYAILYALLLLLALYAASAAYLWCLEQPITHVNVFLPLWVSTYAPEVRMVQLALLILSIAVIVGLPAAGLLWQHYLNRTDKGAHFQSHWELAKYKHFEAKGFPIGKMQHDKVYCDPVSLLLIATTGSYKTAALIVPTLFEHPGSSISTDIKSELWKKTAGFFKATGAKVGRLMLFGNGSEKDYARINPFVYVPWNSEKALNMLNLIVRTLIPTLKGFDTIWAEASRDAVRAVAAHFYLEFENPDHVTLEKIVDFISKPNLFENLGYLHEKYSPHPLYGAWFDVWLAKLITIEDQKLKDSLIYSAQKDIATLFLPTVLRAMSGNDVELRSLRKKRVALFLDVPQGRSDEVKIFLNLFYSVFMTIIAESGEPDSKIEPYRILLNMEEFGDIGKIDKLSSGANTFRSFGLRFIFVVQNFGQIEENYGTKVAKVFLSSGAVIKGGDNNLEDNRYFSHLMGEKITKKTEGKGDARRTSKDYRPLMTPDEIKTLSKKYWLVFLENEPTIKVEKLWDKKDYKYFLKC